MRDKNIQSGDDASSTGKTSKATLASIKNALTGSQMGPDGERGDKGVKGEEGFRGEAGQNADPAERGIEGDKGQRGIAGGPCGHAINYC